VWVSAGSEKVAALVFSQVEAHSRLIASCSWADFSSLAAICSVDRDSCSGLVRARVDSRSAAKSRVSRLRI
jgi:hypothetical protein